MKHLTFGDLWIGFVAVLPACRTEDETPRQDLATATPNLVSLTAAEYTFQAPDTLPAGWTTLRLANHGEKVHYGHIVRLEPGRTVRELVDAYAEAIRTSGPRPKWVTRIEDVRTWLNPERARRADQARDPAPSLASLWNLSSRQASHRVSGSTDGPDLT